MRGAERRRLRLCLFTPTFLPKVGGTEIHADRILRGLLERGHAVAALAQSMRGMRDLDVPYPVYPYRRPPRQHLWPEVLAWPVLRAHRRRPFDVMLAFFGYPNGYAASCVKRRLRFKLLVCGRGADLYPDFHGLRKPRVRRCIVEGYRRADHIVMNSGYMRDRLRAETVALTGSDVLPPLQIIHNGVDLSALRRGVETALAAALPEWAGRAGLRPQRFILHLSRLTEVKEHRLVIEAIAAERSRWEAGGWQYVIAGAGSHEAALRRQTDSCGLRGSVCFVGERFDDDKHWLLGAARAMVSASREEGLPGSLIEAMAVGLPVLASDIPPHREVVYDARAGRFFRSGDARDLAARLFELLEEPRDIASAAGLRASERYGLSKMIDAYEELCVRVVGDE